MLIALGCILLLAALVIPLINAMNKRPPTAGNMILMGLMSVAGACLVLFSVAPF